MLNENYLAAALAHAPRQAIDALDYHGKVVLFLTQQQAFLHIDD
jgi:hypothetical protein